MIEDVANSTRRQFIVNSALMVAGILCPGTGVFAQQSLRIGIIGAGRIGGALGELWVRAGHQVLLSSRHPENLEALARRLGENARVGYPREAAAFGEVVLVSVPFAALPQVGRDFATELNGKIVLETANPYPGRDGPMAENVLERGAGIVSSQYLSGARMVRAFNSIPHYELLAQAHRDGERIGVPLAGDDAQALAMAARLVSDAGFEPVIVGKLVRSRDFDRGTAVYGRALSASVLRDALGVTQ